MAAFPAVAFFSAGAGVRVPSVPGLGGLVETLLTPPAERDPLGQEMPEPDLAPAEPERFGEHRWVAADAVLPADPDGVRLSELLARARAEDAELPALVALRALNAVGTAIGTARNHGDDRVLVAVDDGTVLRDGEFAGADLLVALAAVDGR